MRPRIVHTRLEKGSVLVVELMINRQQNFGFNIEEPEILDNLDMLLKDFSDNKNLNEPFGDYVLRKKFV